MWLKFQICEIVPELRRYVCSFIHPTFDAKTPRLSRCLIKQAWNINLHHILRRRTSNASTASLSSVFITERNEDICSGLFGSAGC
jgi:hypothetical protein